MAGLSAGENMEQPAATPLPSDRGFLPAKRRTATNASANASANPSTARLPVSRDDAVGVGSDGSLSLLDEAGTVVQVAPARVTESLRYMIGRLRLVEGEDLPERLGVTSAISGEGVTFVARTLGMVLANDAAKRVCVVDLNWWSPSNWPSEAEQIGVADVLRDGCAVERTIVETAFPNLYVLPAGMAAPVERPALARSADLDKMLVELSEDFDHVLVDLPAVYATSESLTLAENCRQVVMVVGQGLTPDSQVKGALDELRGISVLGVILNRSRTKIPRVIRKRFRDT
jgi:Mrp family chromosome partitioning ATPase